MGSNVRPVFCEVISSTEPSAMDPDSTEMLRVTCCGRPDNRWRSGEQGKQRQKFTVCRTELEKFLGLPLQINEFLVVFF